MKSKSFFHSDTSEYDCIPDSYKFTFPISSAPFDQGEFIRYIKAEFLRPEPNILFSVFRSKQPSFFQANEIKDLRGLCAALLFLWYNYLEQGKNLLDVLLKGAPSTLIKEIVDLHRKVSKSYVAVPLHLQNEVEILYGPLNKLPRHDLQGFVKVNSILREGQYQNALNAHLTELAISGIHLYGLHTICLIEHDDINKQIGHIFGWTACSEGFLLFDANGGEFLLGSFDHLKSFILHKLMNIRMSDGCVRPPSDYSLAFEDYYSAADLAVCQEVEEESVDFGPALLGS